MTKERRVPTQLRSREKYDHILDAARVLIGDKGNASVSMREISKYSGVALASIYQYFPDKNAILQAIMEGYFDRIREVITDLLDRCKTIDDLNKNMLEGFDLFYALFKTEPALATLWAGLQASPELQELDAIDSQINADMITKKFCAITGNQNVQQINDAIFLILYMVGATVRLALSVPELQGKRLMNELKLLTLLRIKSLT